ncbi:dihydrolipoyl dehydrogenase [Henriciella barbarensis]|uniref:Dihydrolipoyl dehydrogenase n=1 Tax=Henriciella barbarensis TaxID=86342 RepID=A0A399QYE4_9PROT|nr:dihydrolipoyl dehydrogenase [Henriciella barbarensis]
MAEIHVDVAIIGAGTAGLAAERKARAEGARTLLIDPYFAGTTCASVGCMPSKLLIAAGNAAHNVRKAGEFGVETGEPRIDGPKVMARVRRLRDDFVSGVKKQIADLPDGVTVKATARFVSPTELSLDDGTQVLAKAIIIAAGSSPVIPAPFEDLGDVVITNETLFELEDLPQSIGVIGAGPLGLELAQTLARLGVQVEVFDRSAQLAGLDEGEPETSLRRALKAELGFHLEVEPEARRNDDGSVTVSWTENGEARQAHFEKLMVATGRAANLEGLDLEKSGLQLDDNGAPAFDKGTLQCGQSPVFIVGDANGARPILHEASTEGTIAGANAASYPDIKSFERFTRLQVMFTEPNMAKVGADPDEDTIVGRVDFADQGRARAMGVNQGVCEIYAKAKCGALTGATLVGPDAEHLAHLLCWEIENGSKASDLLNKPFYHPTLEEGLKTALKQICQEIGLPKPDSRDDAELPGDFGSD